MRIALQAHDTQPHGLAHAADLALLAFDEDEAQLLGVLPIHLGGLQGLAVQRLRPCRKRASCATGKAACTLA
jgi:hypothetical protein